MSKNELNFGTAEGSAFCEYVLPEEGTDSVTAEMVKYGSLPGIFRPVMGKKEGKTVFRFPLDGILSLDEAEKKKIPGLARGLLLGLCDARISVEEYMLEPHCLWTEPEGIFWNAAKECGQFLCLPGLGKEGASFSAQKTAEWLCRHFSGSKAAADRLCVCAVSGFLAETEAAIDWRKLRKMLESLPAEAIPPTLWRTADGCRFALHRGKNTVGRSEEAPVLCVSDRPAVSRRHLCLEEKEGQWTATDLSLNHTFLNGHRLEKGTPAALCSGDRLRLADEAFVFVC